MIIKNYKELASSSLRKKALDIIITGIQGVLPENCMPKNIKFKNGILSVYGDRFDISKGNVYVIGGGKAVGAMAHTLENIIPLRQITGGIVNTIAPNNTKKIKINVATHPIPNKSGLVGVKKMLASTKNLTEDDTVICLFSGGGSALMPYPADEIKLEELKQMTELMLKSGAETYELNVIRKHISQVAGGKLARILQPARVISLIISDLLDQRDDVASGPTWADRYTFRQALDIIKKYRLQKKIPESIINYVKRGIKGEVPETVKQGEACLRNVHNYVIADNKMALNAMSRKAKSFGYDIEILDNIVSGEARMAAFKTLKVFKQRYEEKKTPYALLYNSEITVNIKGNGKGGRNQEYVAYLIDKIKNFKSTIVVSVDSDGIDYVYGTGGALADDLTFYNSKKLKLNIQKFLKNNNSFELHRRLGNLLLMDPTGTNVGNLNLYLQVKYGF